MPSASGGMLRCRRSRCAPVRDGHLPGPMKRLTTLAVGLGGLAAVGGCGVDDRQSQPAASLDSAVAPTAAAPPADAVATLPMRGDTASGLHADERPSSLFVVRITPESEESGIARHPVPAVSSPGPHARGDTLFADVRAVAEALGVGTRVERRGDTVRVDGVALNVARHAHGGAVYVDVKEFARQFAAYTRLGGPERSGILWTREMLAFWRQNGPTDSEVLLDARREGLLTP